MAQIDRVIQTSDDAAALVKLVTTRTPPFTIAIVDGVKKTNKQNRLQRQWMNDAANQLKDQTAEEYRAYCKLHFGVAIAKECPIYADKYNRMIKPLPYAMKLEMMMEPFDFGVTRGMKKKQMTRYLEAIQRYFSYLGVILTDPELQKCQKEMS